MEDILENRYVFYAIAIICFMNLLADVAAKEFLFFFTFFIMVVVLQFFIENRTLILFIAFMVNNVILLKFKYNQMKYYYMYLQRKENQGNPLPSYLM